ncbi:XTP/dITP diphosphatase [Clostridium polynesiense]|uniref:XTP/dITP diphosphatase n=1 Tax=Clostridium polynesiense TaxID=1325933 RepID=UPI00058AC892|nr:XTP/dITP diphosphatase [Clostridium polynesiense]
MKKLVVASNNEHKLVEIREILNDADVQVLSLKDMNIDIDVVEDGNTFMENAYKKAKEIYQYIMEKHMGEYMVLADDSGLCVDILKGEPGVFSARYAGEHGNSQKNNEKLLKNLKDVKIEDRKARFVCAMVLLAPDSREIKVQGEVEGYIVDKPSGTGGFGYDPIFYLPEFKKTFSEMDSKDKNAISHRGKALEKLRDKLASF